VLIAPRPSNDITWAKSSLESPHGRISVEWDVAYDELTVVVTLPDGVSGVVDLQGREPVNIPDGAQGAVVRGSVSLLL
jgi:alpha-L-rhamnosidase